jgi:hypothetical protein
MFYINSTPEMFMRIMVMSSTVKTVGITIVYAKIVDDKLTITRTLGSETDPQTFHSPKKLFETWQKEMDNLDKCSEEYVNKVGFPVMAVWIHPHHDSTPLEKYLKMDGHRFPGSPKQ